MNIKDNARETALQLAEKYKSKDAADAIKLFTDNTSSPLPLVVNSSSALSDDWKIMETTTTAPKGVARPVASVAENIGTEGGLLQSDGVSIVVPEGAVSIPTKFSIDIYLDEQLMPPVNEEEVVVSPVVHISSSQSSHKFNKPVQLSLRPEVALKPREHETGWLLELKMSESSTEGKPTKWHTALLLNTDTEEVETQSSSIQYDPKTQSLYVSDVGFIVWLGKALGIQSMRDVRYALFGQQLQLHNWKIAAHIVHGAMSTYNEIAENMKSKSYEELTVPIKDRIGLNGKVCVSIECCDPWQMDLGKAVTHIPTRRIWNSRKDAACYYEFTLQDRERSSDTLKCTVQASFEHDKQKKSDDPSDPVTLIVAHPLTKPRITEITTGDMTAHDTILNGDDDISQYAKIVTRNSDKLGGFLLGWSAIPVDVIRDVSHLVKDIGISHLAKSLLSDESVGKELKSILQSRESVFTIIKLWIEEQKDKATLDKLFRSLHTQDLFHLLQQRLDERMQTQKPQKVGIARFYPSVLFDVVKDHGASRYLPLGLEIGLTYDQVTVAAEGCPYSDKLLALYMTKCKEVGEHRAAARLVTAADKISILGFVEDALPGVKAALEESCFYSDVCSHVKEVEETTAAVAVCDNDELHAEIERRSASGTLQNRETSGSNQQLLLPVQAELQDEVEAKQKLEAALTAAETKLRESEMLNRDVNERMNSLQKELDMMRSKNQGYVSSQESAMSFRTFSNSTGLSDKRVEPIATSCPMLSEPATPTRLPLNESAVASAVATASSALNADLYAGEIKEEDESESTSAPESPAITLPKTKKVIPSPKMPHGKPHHFQVETFRKPTKCHYCTSIMIGLFRQGMCCEVCHYSCHFQCAKKVPYPCPTSSDKSMRLSGIDPKKGIGTAYEGWVKVPKPGGVKKGWLRQYAIVCDFKLFLYEPTTLQGKENTVSVSIVTTVDMRDEMFEVGGVQKSDVIHARSELLSSIFKVVASAYNTNGPQAQLLVLTESPNEQRQWVNMLRELKKELSQMEQPVKMIYIAKEVYDSSQLKFLGKTTCAAVVDSHRIVVGTEKGLCGVKLADDALSVGVVLFGEEECVYQLEVILDEQLIAVLSGRQKHVRLYPLPALDGQQLEGVVEVQESKGAQVFAWGSIRVSALNGLCVAVKKKVYVYELYNTLKHKKIKEIVTQREAQWMGVFNGKLCVGYTSGFILYSVQGEGQATSLIHIDDLSPEFVTLNNRLDAMCCIELDQEKGYLFCFNMVGVYVDAQGRRARRQELMWPSLPLSISYSAPYVIVCSQNTVDIFDVQTAEWLQTLHQKRTHALCRDGSLVLWHGSDTLKLLFLKGVHLDDSDAKLCVPDGNCRGRRVVVSDKRASKRWFSLQRILGGSGARTTISYPSDFRHIQHYSPDDALAILASNENPNKLGGKPTRALSAVALPVASTTRPARPAPSLPVLKSSSLSPSSGILSSPSNGPNDSVAIPRHLSDQPLLHNENILQVDPTTGHHRSMHRSSFGSVGSSFPHSIHENSPSNVSQSSDMLPTDEPPPQLPVDDFDDGRQSRDGAVDVGQDTVSAGDSEGSPPSAYTFPSTDN
ncbi:uncharacterized protein LOC134198062 isoform X2 [Corticium candelabrum]|uniref:uncharacterized protein LOC134198062 isoform X2 n=1 Tax=Corticium candelabrum TaxID=121492 RepID=UPI002E26CA25|nr:uncharacterized protein LOC134198062 isoform X2 [Corticium candelabrum]